MIFPSLGGYIVGNTKEIIFLNFFSDYSYGRYIIYYLQKKYDFWESFSSIAL